MNTPLVSIVTLTTSLRAIKFLDRITKIVQSQDYINIEHIIVSGDDEVIGAKRNEGCKLANGEYIVFFDDDDFYAANYVSLCISFMQKTGCNVTGLNKAFFYKPNVGLWLWQYGGSNDYVIESGMCFKKSIWNDVRFPNIQIGENVEFLSKIGGIEPHGETNSMIAIIHDNNTSSHLALKNMKAMDVRNSHIFEVMGNMHDLFS